MSLIITLAIAYVAIVSLVLKTFHYMRDRNINDAEIFHAERPYKQSA